MSAGLLLVIALAGLVGGIAVLVLRTSFVYFVTFFVITVAIGLAHYYGGEERSYWLAAVFCGAVAGKYFLEFLQQPASLRLMRHRPIKLLAAFLLWGTFVSVVAGIGQSQALLALKNYFAIWLVAIPAVWLGMRSQFLSRFEWALLGLFALQLPFAVWQNFTTDNWDAVVGTFGGDVEGGGASGTLMVYVIVGTLVAISWWQRQKAALWFAALAVALAFLIMIQGEVKAFFIMMPLGVAVMLRRLMLKRPLQSGLLLVSVALGSYVTLGIYADSEAGSSTGRSERITSSFEYFFDTTYVSARTGEVSRGASIALWFESGGNTAERLVGYGLGASRLSDTVEGGSVTEKFGQAVINSTTIAQLLWDTGIIGLCLYVSIFISALRLAFRIAREAPNRTIQSRADLMAGIIVLAFPLLIYDRSLVDGPAIHFLFASCVGMLCGLEKYAAIVRGQAMAEFRQARQANALQGTAPAT
ncbi:hypothetical protein [Qipengyuania gaetbuli]|uniref:hypothetical protein n=1 Tax=Qipengyuania gaetbuli TaxID=266952 RepID=UPI001CD1B547|nr:hypothetical protein [Qipengyuania gaetbuli]MCA0908931.1 hypothetical protein [Qipengyuania gaetbuli]